jgi:hypothetical protein
MPEMPHTGENHRDIGLVGGGYHLFIANRAAGLDHSGGAGLRGGVETVCEGEEGV